MKKYDMAALKHWLSGVMISTLLVLSALSLAQAQTGNIDPTDKYAWPENAGWLNFRPTHGGVTVYADHLEGFAWAENIGWVRLGSYTGGGTHAYANTSAADYGVNQNGSGALSGYAWSENAGWINFKPTHGGVTIGPDGRFDGYAWAENVGWVHVQNASPAYNVRKLNEAPTDLSLAPSSVPENLPVGTTVGTFTTTDPDNGNTFTYTLVSGTGSADNASFTIAGSTLQTNTVFVVAIKSSYSIRVRTTDQGGLSYEEAVTVTVFIPSFLLWTR